MYTSWKGAKEVTCLPFSNGCYVTWQVHMSHTQQRTLLQQYYSYVREVCTIGSDTWQSLVCYKKWSGQKTMRMTKLRNLH